MGFEQKIGGFHLNISEKNDPVHDFFSVYCSKRMASYYSMKYGQVMLNFQSWKPG